MKTLITVIMVCTALYAGIGMIKNVEASTSNHNQELNKAIALLER
ncbi:MAG: hypothetical protein PHE67_12725 [Campylobacterales bacterium]|jgi:hypothetical protein|nr:hypothetical protein [Campylobacterales bacterium]